jgi:hypothetical protein
MVKRTKILLLVAFTLLAMAFIPRGPAAASTTSLTITKYTADGATVIARVMVYVNTMKSLPVYGDGVTHYYHQGPVFEGDVWDPGETFNLKDKGAVKGTSVRNLCDVVGGMPPGSELVIRAVDGYSLTLTYDNIYEPADIQGEVVLCWFKGRDVEAAETHESGYPGKNAFASALQIVFVAGTVNGVGQHVFGNTDMKISLPEEKYQHFYEGLPSTNGLSGKWINELRIYPKEAPAVIPDTDSSLPGDMSSPGKGRTWLPLALGAAGLILVTASISLFLARKRRAKDGY